MVWIHIWTCLYSCITFHFFQFSFAQKCSNDDWMWSNLILAHSTEMGQTTALTFTARYSERGDEKGREKKLTGSLKIFPRKIIYCGKMHMKALYWMQICKLRCFIQAQPSTTKTTTTAASVVELLSCVHFIFNKLFLFALELWEATTPEKWGKVIAFSI